MKQTFLKMKRKLGNLAALSLMLFLSLLWSGTAKSQMSPLSTNLVTFNFLPGGANTVANAPENGTARQSLYRTGYANATLDSLLLSHMTGVIAGTTASWVSSPVMGYNTLTAADNCIRLDPYFASSNTASNTTQGATPTFIQTSVVLTGGKIFDANAAIQLELITNTSLGTLSSTINKSYQIYYKYYSSTPGLVTSANDTISLNPSATTIGGSGNSYDLYANSKSNITSSTSAFQLLNLSAKSGSTTSTALSGFAPYNDNVVSIPAPGNNTSTVLVIQVRIWGTGTTATANNLRLAYLSLSTATAPHAALSSPTIDHLETTNIDAGTTGPQTIYIDGTNFDATGTTVKFNGVAHTVNYVNANQISIDLSTADMATANTYPIVVSNGSGTTDATINFIVNALPTVAISNNGTQPSVGNITQASGKNNLQSFILTVGNNNATLNTVVAHISGTYTTHDISSFKLYSNSSNNLGTATLLASQISNTTNASTSTTGSENVTFTLTSNNTFNVGSTYFWVVVSPSSNANIASPVSTVAATVLSTSDFTFATGIKSGSVSAGGAQTIVQGITAYMDDITNQPTASPAQNSKVALAGFTINPGAATPFTAVNVFANGTATATDITSLQIYKDVNADGIYEAGTDVLVSTNSPIFSTSATVPMAFTLNENISTKTQYLLVATFADVFVSTIGHTVQLSINDTAFTTSASVPPSNNMNGANSLTIVAPTGTSVIATSGTPAATISALDTTVGQIVPVYSFTYHNDNTNTSAASLISQIVIGQGASNSALFVNWTNIIGGATLSDGTNTINGTVGASGITFSSIPTTVGAIGNVATNTTKTYTLSIYLKQGLSTAIRQGINGSKLAFALANSGITVTGSTLAASQSSNSGSNGAISVTATKLAYIQAPSGGIPNANLSPAIKVQAEDANGNYATGYTGTITVSSVPTGITGTLSSTASNGLATFSALQFPSIGTYTITATDGTFSVASSCSIVYGLYTGNSAGTAYTWEGSTAWGSNSLTTSGTSWVEGYDAFFGNTKGSTVTVGSNHSSPSLNFVTSGYTLTGTGTLSLTGSTPTVNIASAGSAIFNLPLSATNNVVFAPISGLATMTIGANAAGNLYSANFPNGATLAPGLTTVNLLNSYPFGTTNSNLYVQSSITNPAMITTSGAGVVTTPMPLIVPNNIVISTGGALSLCPTGASAYGNIIKYTGVISGAANAICLSNALGSSLLFATGGKGMVYFGAKNTYTGTTYMSGNQGSLICGGGDNTLPSTTDVLFYTGATAGDAPFLDLNGSNEKVMSISGTDGAATHVTTNLYPGGVYNSLTYTQNYSATTHSVNVFDSLIASYITSGGIAVGTKVMGSGITYGNTIKSITKKTVSGYTIDSIELNQTITNVLQGNQGFYLFFENPSQKTLTIEGVGTVGGPYDPQVGHTIDRTNANFGGTINGNVALTLSANNSATNKLTLLNTNTYIGATTVTGGTLVLAAVGGNTIPVADSVIVNGGTLEIKTSQTLSNVNLSAGTLLVDAGDTLTITGYFTNTGGTITNNGTIIYNGGAFTQNGSTIANNGKFNVTAGNFTVAAGTFTTASSDSLTVTNNTINVSGGTFINNGGIKAATNLTVSGGVFTQNVNQTFNNVSVTSKTATLNIGTSTNPTVLINGTLTYGGNITNSGNPITYGVSGALIYNLGGKYQINNASEFVAPSLPSTVTLSAGDTLVLDQDYVFPGSLVNNGVITSVGSYLAAHKLSLTGTSNLSGNGSIAVLEINKAGGTITNSGTDSLKIINKLILTNGTLVSNGKITIKSTSLDSTAIVDVVTGGSVSGNVVSERFVPSGFRAFRDLAPGVNTNGGTIFSNWQENGAATVGTGIFITGSKNAIAGVDATSGLDYSSSGAPSSETYRNGNWYIYNNNSTYGTPYYTKSGIYSTLDYHYGYRMLVRGDRSFNLATWPSQYYMANATKVRTVGTLVTGNVDYSNYLNNNLNTYSMIGNPYLAPIDFNAIYNDADNSHSNLTTTYYFLTRNDSTKGITGPQGALSSYATYDVIFGGNTPAVTQYIMPGQSFFVQNNGTGTTGTFIIKESHKVTGNSRKQFGIFGVNPLGAASNLYVTLFKNITGTTDYAQADQVKLLVNSSLTSNGVGTNKLLNGSDNLAFIEGTKVLAIDGYKAITAKDTITLSIDQLTASLSYKLKVDATAFSGTGFTAMLLDRLTNTFTSLVGDTAIISFTPTATANTFGKRFALVFKANGLPVKEINLSATKEKDDVMVNWNTVAETKVATYTVESSINGSSFVAATTLSAKNAANASYSYSDKNSTASYYRIKATDLTGAISYSNVVVVSGNAIVKISAFPNPIVGNVLHLSTSGLSAGKYSVILRNTIGQRVFASEIDGSASNHDLKVGSLTAGQYILSIIAEGKVVNNISLQVK